MGVREALLNEGKEIGKKIGFEEGEANKTRLFVTNLLRETTFSVSRIASLCGVAEFFVRKVKKELNN